MTIIKKFEPVENQKFSKKYITLIIISIFALMLIEIWVNNSMVSFGGKFEKMSQLTRSLSLENQILENEIAAKQALKSVASKSAELGFSQPESIQYIR